MVDFVLTVCLAFVIDMELQIQMSCVSMTFALS